MTTTRSACAAIALLLFFGLRLEGQPQTIPQELGIKYTRDAEEYATLARQVYRTAGDALARLAPAAGRAPWAVVLDVDETALDNSVYQLERATYGLPFDQISWSAWVRRRQAPAVPGVVDFIVTVRKAGGHVAWITNRLTANREDTRMNLRSAELWGDDDRLCSQSDQQPTKKSRRAEVAAGTGDCAWAGMPMRIVLFVGDQMSDFPDADEQVIGASGDADFGRTLFLLPNPMYGAWTTRVTRTAR